MLLAIDLSAESEQLLIRVRRLCQDQMSGVHVVHVLRSIDHQQPAAGQRIDDPDCRRLQDRAARRLIELLFRNGFDIDPQRIYVRVGEPAHEIKSLAHQLAADLVVVGSHLKGDGWMALPGATTNCVLQGIDTDVMAVRV